MHRHVRRIGDQVAVGVKQRAAEVQPLFDVDRMRRVLQLQTHLLGDVHEEVVEDLQQHWVDLCACGKLHRACRAPFHHQMIQRGERGLPAGLHHRGGIFLGNDGRAGNNVTGLQVFTHHQRSIVPLAG